MTLETNKFLIGIVTLMLVSRTTLSIVFSPLAFLPLITGALIIVLNFFKNGFKFSRKAIIFLMILLLLSLVQIILFPLLTIQNGTFIPFLGIFQYIFPILFWYSFFYLNEQKREFYFSFFIDLIYKFGLLVALLAYVQYFLSPSIYGLVENNVYAPSDGEINPNVTIRAISLISSPQSLGLFLGFCLALHFSFKSKTRFAILKLLIIFGAGILTGSKAFLIFIGIFFMLNLFRYSLRFGLFALAILALAPFLYQYVDIGTLERYGFIISRILFLNEYNTFQIWMSYIFFPSNFFQELFGHGMGVMGTASQSIYDYQIMNGSTESFLVQILFEAGAITLFTFLIFLCWCLFKCYNNKKLKSYGGILVASLFVMIGTPAFYGFVNSFWLWAILIYISSEK